MKTHGLLRALFSFLILVSCLAAQAKGSGEVQAGPYRVSIGSDSPTLAVGRARLIVTLADHDGKPVLGAKVSGLTQMPGMAMGEREQTATPGKIAGTYQLPASLAMEGRYDATLHISGPLGSTVAVVPLETGQSMSQPGTAAVGAATGTAGAGERGSNDVPWLPIIYGLLLIAAVGFVRSRMRKTGQRLNLRPILSGAVLFSLALLALVLIGAIYAVNHFRRAGAMTPVEAQVMKMDVPTPEAATPVVLAEVVQKSFQPTVEYPGQAVGYVEQDVSARGAGIVVWMPYYVGDAVKKGQVLARLDTTQSQPQVAEKSANLATAESGIRSAEADYAQAQSAVREAEAEFGEHDSMVAAATAEVDQAKEAKRGTAAQVLAATAEVTAAVAAADSADAELVYAQQSLARSRQLYAAGALTKDELQRDISSAAKAAASYAQNKELITGARARLAAAQATDRAATSSITAAEKRVVQAKSELMVHHAHVATSRAAAVSAREKIAMATAQTHAAAAGLAGASAANGYAELRAESDGVISQRLMSPGVLVSPGQAVLRVAQIDPIRLQAFVPESDLRRINVGAVARIRTDDGRLNVNATISSVSPTVDPASHMGVVEVIFPNKGNRFNPGQFLTMAIAVGPAPLRGSEASALVVPAAAIHTEIKPSDADPVATGERHFVWLAQPVEGQPGHYTAERKPVEIGESSLGGVAITSGLMVGDKVVLTGGLEVQEGATLTDQRPEHTPPPMARAKPTKVALEVDVTEAGFTPSTISITAGFPTRITFLRKTENTCAKAVVFPGLGLTRSLPLNVPVMVDIPARAKGRLAFACGMNMQHGEVVIR